MFQRYKGWIEPRRSSIYGPKYAIYNHYPRSQHASSIVARVSIVKFSLYYNKVSWHTSIVACAFFVVNFPQYPYPRSQHASCNLAPVSVVNFSLYYNKVNWHTFSIVARASFVVNFPYTVVKLVKSQEG